MKKWTILLASLSTILFFSLFTSAIAFSIFDSNNNNTSTSSAKTGTAVEGVKANNSSGSELEKDKLNDAFSKLNTSLSPQSPPKPIESGIQTQPTSTSPSSTVSAPAQRPQPMVPRAEPAPIINQPKSNQYTGFTSPKKNDNIPSQVNTNAPYTGSNAPYTGFAPPPKSSDANKDEQKAPWAIKY